MSELSIGQVWQSAGLKRKVVEILRDRATGAVFQIGWQRPCSDWKTFYASVASWKTWKNKASLDLVSSAPY